MKISREVSRPAPHILTRLDNRVIPEGARELRAFLPVRNERVRLEWFLSHHRRLGIDRFFIVDNGSDDGSVEFLLGQPDCHVFRTWNSYAESRFGVGWINALLSEHGTGRWCLSLDADELFVYPDWESVGLRDLAGFLEREAADGVFAFLLDMYGAGPVADTHYEPGTPFLDTCPYFDRNYRFGRQRFRLGQAPPFPPLDVIGGPRLRCFFPEYVRPSVPRRQLQRVGRLISGVTGQVPLRPPYLPKIPFVQWGAGMQYVSSHRTTPIKLSALRGTLLHFKFFSDFHQRVITEVKRGEHFAGGAEYARYLRRLERPGGGSFFDVVSVAYRDSGQLLDLGLMQTSDAWRDQHRFGNPVAA
jgi:hypothetical protein